LELPGVDAPRAKLAALLLALVVAASLAVAGLPGSARAATRTVTATTTTTVAASDAPVLVTSQNTPPKGYRLTAAKVE
jgi:hypothetical protein